MDFQECTGSVAFAMRPFSAVNAYLPPGYEAEDAAVFFTQALGAPVPNVNQALFALILTDCTLSHTDRQEYLAVAWVFLKPPTADWMEGEADLNWYEWKRYSHGPELPESLAQFHWEAEIGNITTGVISNPPYLAARTWSMGENPEVFTMSHEGSGAPISATGLYRTWNAHENGTTVYEFDLEASLLLGPGVCAADPNHWTFDFIGGACGDRIVSLSPEIQYAAFTDLNLDGTFFFEPNRFVV